MSGLARFPFFQKHGSRVFLLFSFVALIFTSQNTAAYSKAGAFSLPEAGTYKLGHITKFPKGWVLETSPWFPKRLSSYTSDKITLFTFFYSTCRDAEGCPAVWSTFQSVHDEIVERNELHGKVRLVFLSLDPRLDTPKALSVFSHARMATHKAAPWHFLTTWSDWFLGPIIEGLGQSASRDLDENGTPLLTISHQIKFYLVDDNSWIREIYSSNFIDVDVIITDMRTLLMESEQITN